MIFGGFRSNFFKTNGILFLERTFFQNGCVFFADFQLDDDEG